jgi:hypothetical protein
LDLKERKLHNDVFHGLYSSPNIVRVIKSRRRMRWAKHVERMEEGRSVYRLLVGRLKGKKPLERPRLRWTLGRQGSMKLTEFGWFSIDSNGEFL